MSVDIIQDFSDVVMGYFDYTNAPLPTYPQANKDYSYPLSDVSIPQVSLDATAEKIDCLSKESEQKWFSFLTKKKAASLLGIVASIAMGVSVFTSISNPALLVISGIALPILGIYSLYHFVSSWMSYDLENEATRTYLRKDFLSKTFSEISDQFSVDELIGFDLLKEKMYAESTIRDSSKYYEVVRAFYQEKQILVSYKNKDISQVRKIFNNGTQNFRSWYNLANSRLRNSETLRHLRKKYDQNNNRNVDYMTFVNRYMSAVIDGKFNDLMSPWRAWLNTEKINIESAYNKALAHLDAQFIRV